jgi:hypothetical protein
MRRWFAEPDNNKFILFIMAKMTVVIPTTPEVALVCDELEKGIGRFLDSRSTLPPLGRYESQVEALNLFYLALRDIEGVVALARTDLVLIPPALASARAGFEAAVKAMWMVDADDPFECEGRWLAHLKAEERFHNRIAARFDEIGKDAGPTRKLAESIASFSQAVQEILPSGIPVLNGNPSVDKMLESAGVDHLYATYIYLSQFAHAEHAATWLYRSRGLGVEKVVGDFTKPADWHVPLGVAWFSLVHIGRVLLTRLGGDTDLFIHKEYEEHVVRIIEQIGLTGIPQGDRQ